MPRAAPATLLHQNHGEILLQALQIRKLGKEAPVPV